MTAEVMSGKQTLDEYHSRLAAAPVTARTTVLATAAPTAEGLVALQQRLVGASVDAAEADVASQSELKQLETQREKLRVRGELEELEEARDDRVEERRQRRAERQETNQIGVLGLVQQLLAAQGAPSSEVAELRVQLQELADGRRDEAWAAEASALREEISATRALVLRADDDDDLLTQIDRIKSLRDHAEQLFGGPPTAAVDGDLQSLELLHRQKVSLLELEHRMRNDDRRIALEERKWEVDAADRDRRGDMFEGVLSQLAPAAEKIISEFGARAAAESTPAAAAATVPPAGGGGLTLVDGTARAQELPPGVVTMPCPQDDCDAELTVHHEQNVAVCPGCATVITNDLAAGAVAVATAPADDERFVAPEPPPSPNGNGAVAGV